jgi:cellulose biosynthesis protein BcsQ
VKTIATYSIKGGVGKTTAAVNLAFEAARTGARVLVWDLDPQGAASWLLRVDAHLRGGAAGLVRSSAELARHVRSSAHESIHVVPADLSLRHLDLELDDVAKPAKRLRRLLRGVEDHYDLALLDCPPAISLASESVFGAAHALVVPTIPSTLSIRTLDQLTEFLAEWRSPPEVLPFISMFDARRRVQRDAVVAVRDRFPTMLGTAIPAAAVVEQMGERRSPIGEVAPRSAAAAAFRALWLEVSAQLWS